MSRQQSGICEFAEAGGNPGASLHPSVASVATGQNILTGIVLMVVSAARERHPQSSLLGLIRVGQLRQTEAT